MIKRATKKRLWRRFFAEAIGGDEGIRTLETGFARLLP